MHVPYNVIGVVDIPSKMDVVLLNNMGSQAGRTKPPLRKAVCGGRSWYARTVVYGPTIVRPAPRTSRLGTTASPNSRKEETRCSNTLPLCLQRPYPR